MQVQPSHRIPDRARVNSDPADLIDPADLPVDDVTDADRAEWWALTRDDDSDLDRRADESAALDRLTAGCLL